VNLSPRQFAQPDLMEQVSRILCDTNLSSSTLILEITEGMLLDNFSSTERTLRDLERMGIRVAIDDFGTGYSSLSYLYRYEINSLKIDRSFIDRLGKDGQTATGLEIVRAILAMAREMEIQVVAEGIENRQQMQLLAALDCDYGQGYYISVPLREEAVDDFLKGQNLLQ
jgi:EAL domain-containing protein (putative c-di-GMP-specific phosphodiesterase class I)